MTTEYTEEVELPAEDVVEDATVADNEPRADKKPTRPKLPEGWGTPIEFAKALDQKLIEEGRKSADDEPFRPQVIYSHIRNRSKDPEKRIPVYFVDPQGNVAEEETEGYRPAFRKDENGVLQEALDWWEAKDARVRQSKLNAAAKKANKGKKEDSTPAEETLAADEVSEDYTGTEAE
jgi:hypothetical protein